jgi:hypothetical protein
LLSGDVENMKLYEPSLLNRDIDEQVLPPIKDLALEPQEELVEDTIL